MSSVFSEFTRQYALSKTLKFELKPVGRTQEMLEDAKVFEKDKTIQKKYEATKPYFDRLHREFVRKALENTVLSELNGYLEIFKKWKTDKKANEKELQEKEKNLRKEVVKFFDVQAKSWAETYSHLGIKKADIKLFFEEEIFKILEERYGGEAETKIVNEATGETVSIFDSWKGFTGYFKKFQETRVNFYKDDGTATALATRIVDQNLKRFCDNLVIFESIKEKLNFSEIENDLNKSLGEIFSLHFYNECLLQDGIDFYNDVLGGRVMENGEKQKGVNEVINLHKQQTGERLPFLKLLDKQILSEKEKHFVNEITDDSELLDVLKAFYTSAEARINPLQKLLNDFTQQPKKYDLSQIYISKEAFNTISHKWTGETQIFEQGLFEAMKGEKLAKYEKKEERYKFPDFIALSYIQEALEGIELGVFWKERYSETFDSKGKTLWEQFVTILEFEFNSLFDRKGKNPETGEEVKLGYVPFRERFERLLKDFKLDTESKRVIKDFADEVLRIYQMGKYFALEKKRKWVGDDYELGNFYEDPEMGFKVCFYDGAYEEIIQTYNKLRNYLTKKPYSEEKWKLNFENPTLADGWDKNKESDNSAIILTKDGKYFLGLMRKGHNKIFDERHITDFSQNIEQGKYRKVIYKFFPDQAKMFPKVCFSTKGLGFFQPTEEIRNIYKNSEFKKGDAFSISSMHKLIDFYKDCLTKYEGWKGYDFKHLKPTQEYKENIGEFFRDIAEDGYKISFRDISESYIREKNEKGELYLFQIRNKDWNEGATGAKNLHTLYFEGLFSTENMDQNFPLKLNGQTEIFYRPKTEKEKLGTKKDKQGKEVIAHKRYNENKIFLHVPMTVNRTKRDPYQFNAQVNNFLANNPDINVVGVDRGEKHLAYYSVISQEGKILESGSLNNINAVDYHQKLSEKAKNREQARKDWQDVQGIKDLKKGYISQVVRKLADLAIEHNAIIVFEDLNMRFKQIRGGIEKSVYQQLERALIEKLNFLVNKGEKDSDQAGHLLRAYQLTAPFTTFKDMGKQTGIIFYTQAAYTSRIDPVTGWRPNLYLKYSSAEKAKEDILQFSHISFARGRFEFSYDIKNFQNQKEYPKKTLWTVCSCVERFRWNRKKNNNKRGYDHYPDLTDDFTKLFQEYEIDLQGNIKEQIEVLETKGNEKFFRDFIFLFNLLCQIRNTDEEASDNDQKDFILSPVEPFFDSRKNNGAQLPQNGDDNGAFNIARKGLLVLKKISKFYEENGGCEKMNWADLYVSSVEWDNWVSQNTHLQN